MHHKDIPYGYCHCGCGQKTRIAKYNDARSGEVKGQPRRFLKAHHHRGKVVSLSTREKLGAANAGPRSGHWKGSAASYRALHAYLSKYYPKSGVCELCKRTRRTEYALIHGRTYSRDRLDYRELCKDCHLKYDDVGTDRGGASRYRGVARQRLGWRAYGSIGGRQSHLGQFDDELAAARAAEAFRRKHMPHVSHDIGLEPVPPCACRMCD